MKVKNLCIAVVILVAAAFAVQAVIGAMVTAQDDPSITNKLNEILKGQQSIAADIASIKSELNIVKIRVTQTQ